MNFVPEFFSIVTAYFRRMGEGNSFSLFVSPHLGGGVPWPGPDGGGYPGQVQMRIPSQVQMGYPSQVQLGGYPSQVQRWCTPHPKMGTPCPEIGYPHRPDMGYPHPEMEYPLSRDGMGTWYAEGGVPLAFTQENFLVSILKVVHDDMRPFFLIHESLQT